MAGMGRPPKSPATRQRRNRTSTVAELPAPDEVSDREVPVLPPRADGKQWDLRVLDWWNTVWRSPMAVEFLEADMKGSLFLLADLHQIRWTATNAGDLIEVSKEIRLQEQRFGLSPIDRRRLQWSVPNPDRKGGQGAPKQGERAPRRPVKDPRSVLKVG